MSTKELVMGTGSHEELLGVYREGADGTSATDPKVANKWQRKMHECYKKLRETPLGREGIIGLMKDPSPHVRCWAGAHSLQWEPNEAKSTLEALWKSGGPCSFDAEITLEEFSKGNLSFDY
jgi:hypothetical protein